ncbi:MAG: DUF4012 domain-containing protein [Patescibacteria group bacterium]|nr:DUF4012 domain-containing protein [Patescibacteria group bacterium]
MTTKLHKSNEPTALIIHGANFIGQKLAELLSSQRTNIIVVDEFTRTNKKCIQSLKKELSASVYDLSAIKSLTTDLPRIDYVFILLDQYLLLNPEISGQKFLSETNVIDATLKLSHKHSAKVLLTSSVSIHRRLTDPNFIDSDKLSDISSPKPYTSFELQRYCENLAAEYHDQTGLNIRIARLGEVIGKGMQLEGKTVLVNMLKQAVTKSRLRIRGEGLESFYYVHTLDAVYGLIKANFSNKTNGEVFSLSYEEELSVLNLAYRILELNPTANEIVFVEADPKSTPQKLYVPAKNLSKIGWKPKVMFDHALAETVEYFYDEYKLDWTNKPDHTLKPVNKQASKSKKTQQGQKTHASERITKFGKFLFSFSAPFRTLRSKLTRKPTDEPIRKATPKSIAQKCLLGTILIILYFAILAPISQVLTGAGLTYYFANRAYDQAYELNVQDSKVSLEKASHYSTLMKRGWHGLRWCKFIPGIKDYYNESSSMVTAINHMVQGSYYFIQGVEPYVEYFKNFEPITSFDDSTARGSREYQTELIAMSNNVTYIELANVEISLALEDFNSVDTSIFPRFTQTFFDDISHKTQTLNETLVTIKELAFHLPELLGKDGRKNYVVLFQNPMELRSTGGWLTSYAILGIEHGQIRTMTVDDVYNADGQLETTISPPESMAQALDISEWNLSLSNWSPDFSEAADSAEYFLKLENIISGADGVIAVDLEFVRELIDVWGQIDVPGETESITKDNLYEKVVEIHRAFTPGSTAKPVFLSNLANELMLKLFETSRSKWPEIAQTMSSSLNEKHILVHIHNTQVNELLNSINWSGQMPDKTNFIYPVEWNWGGNKANHFLNRSVVVKSNITGRDSVQQTLIISYKNNSTINQYPEGDYHNFIRIYFPEGISISRVEGLEKSKLENNTVRNMDILSGWANVPVNSTKTLSVTYTLDRTEVECFPVMINPNGTITYELNIIKQAGIQADPLTVEISYPAEWIPSDLTNVHRELNTLIRRTDLRTDKQILMQWEE